MCGARMDMRVAMLVLVLGAASRASPAHSLPLASETDHTLPPLAGVYLGPSATAPRVHAPVKADDAVLAHPHRRATAAFIQSALDRHNIVRWVAMGVRG
jgi:hypothetical protein